jgi:predicted O-methyltransferase YrrM
MDGIDPQWQAYADRYTSPESELLQRIYRETHLQVLQPRMLSGHFQGRLLAMISSMIQPRRILEIGTYTGYSALCLAEGLAPNGTLLTIDVNEELEKRVRGYFRASAYADRIEYRVGDARAILPTLTDVFDLVFIDADKAGYEWYYETVLPMLRPGGFILADNVLWSGKVTRANNDKDTRIIQQFNDRVLADSRVDRVLLPIRDGLFLIRKRSA